MGEPLANLLFEYPCADTILRSHDTHHFRVPRSYIVNSSPVLDRLIRAVLPPDDTHEGALLPVIQLPESGAILHSLLTFIFPVIPLLPPTTEEFMELLSVAQKYQMESVLAHIRLSITRYYPPSAQRGATYHMYSLAHKYGLRQEALQAARIILKYPMNIEDLEDTLDVMSGGSLYGLYKYSEQVRGILASDLMEFRSSGARSTLTGLRCVQLSSSQIPRWLDDYIASIGDAPHLFDLIEFNTAMTRHVASSKRGCTSCGSIPSQTMRNFWEALTSVVDDSFANAESALSLVQEQENSQTQVNSGAPVPEPLNFPDANLIIQSSDLVNFHVHKSVLAIASPVFKDLFSLHQPSDSDSVDGLPVVQLIEDAEILNSLFSMIYLVRLVIPSSYDKVLYLLSTCQKYEMDQVQAFIRAEVSRGSFPMPVGTEVFCAYAIASSKQLIPEMESAARLTLDHPMTLETLGEVLRLFEGSALRDLARFRKRCRDNLVTCIQSFLDLGKPPFKIWMYCPNTCTYSYSSSETGHSPSWLISFFKQRLTELDQGFTKPLPNPSNISEQYKSALQAHTTSSSPNVSCVACTVVHTMKGETFCKELENRMALAISESARYKFCWNVVSS